MIFFGEDSLRQAIHEFMIHYHRERNHQGLENRLITPHGDDHLFSKYPIFFHQVLDDLLLMLVDPARNGDDEKGELVESLVHCCRFSESSVSSSNDFNGIEFLHSKGVP